MRGFSTRGLRVRRTIGLLVAAAALTACNEGSAPDRNLPKDSAENREFSYPAYQASPESADVWELEGRRWQASGVVETIEAQLLKSVANASGTAIYALASDPAPYDRLYAPAGQNRWRVIHPID